MNSKIYIGLNGNLNGNLNDDGIVKNTMGLASAGCMGMSMYTANQKDTRGTVVFLCGSLLFGIGYYLLDKKDDKKVDKKYEHEEQLAHIKHPRCMPMPTSVDNNDKEEGMAPLYLKKIDHEPSSSTLNELAHIPGADVVPLAGGLLYSGDVSMFFSIANKGKTILGVQLAVDIASGNSTLYPEDGISKPINVIYLNFEMSKSQMNKRLAPNGVDNAMSFPYNLEMRDCKGCFDDADKFLEYIAGEVEKKLECDTVIFIDTITDICPQFFNKEAAKFLGALRTIQAHAKNNKNITITFILLGHTMKHSHWEPLDMENLKGGGNQANLVDSMFALGTARLGNSIRYLKMLKNRNAEIKDKVDLIKIVNEPYLHFENIGSDYEENVLPSKPKPKNVVKAEKIGGESLLQWDGPVPLDTAREMTEYYKEGVSGHGWDATAKEFGLKHGQEAKRIIQKYRDYLDKQ